MNLYVRYFDHETLATNMDEVVAFLSSIREIKVDDSVIDRILNFADSNDTNPFRLKVSYSNYVLFLKTEAKDLAEFKYLEKMRKEQRTDNRMTMADRKRTQMEQLNEPHIGWYEASLTFKRVVQNPDTGKCQYVDTFFKVRLKAKSALDAYNRIIEHLQNRQDVDPRSQFPSAKSSNYEYTFLDIEREAAERIATEQPSEPLAEQAAQIASEIEGGESTETQNFDNEAAEFAQ